MNRPLYLTLATTAILAIVACDRTPAITMSQNEARAPQPVRLSSDARSRLGDRFDVAALEALLGTMTATEQQELLEGLGASGSAPAGGETKSVTVMMRSTDPVRQALLDQMWAPFWDHLPPELLDRTDLPYPGRDLAKARQAARRANERSRGQ
jgi:hypothetical protein